MGMGVVFGLLMGMGIAIAYFIGEKYNSHRYRVNSLLFLHSSMQ